MFGYKVYLCIYLVLDAGIAYLQLLCNSEFISVSYELLQIIRARTEEYHAADRERRNGHPYTTPHTVEGVMMSTGGSSS